MLGSKTTLNNAHIKHSDDLFIMIETQTQPFWPISQGSYGLLLPSTLAYGQAGWKEKSCLPQPRKTQEPGASCTCSEGSLHQKHSWQFLAFTLQQVLCSRWLCPFFFNWQVLIVHSYEGTEMTFWYTHTTGNAQIGTVSVSIIHSVSSVSWNSHPFSRVRTLEILSSILIYMVWYCEQQSLSQGTVRLFLLSNCNSLPSSQPLHILASFLPFSTPGGDILLTTFRWWTPQASTYEGKHTSICPSMSGSFHLTEGSQNDMLFQIKLHSFFSYYIIFSHVHIQHFLLGI